MNFAKTKFLAQYLIGYSVDSKERNMEKVKRLFIVAVSLAAICVLLYLCGFEELAAFIVFPILGVAVQGVIAYNDFRTTMEYNKFSDTSNDRLGMTGQEVMDMYNGYPMSFTKEINTSSVTKCPTCGGVVENGTCLYCKNKYDDNSDLSVMEFDGHYGKKVFLFKNGRLASVRVEMEPLENFLY